MKKILLSLLATCSAMMALAQPSVGYYNQADGKSQYSLKTAMFQIIQNPDVVSYKDLWTAFRTTDVRPDGKVWDMYSNITNYTFGTDQAGNTGNEGKNYNREHSFPKSWFNDATPMYSDLFHLYPTDTYVNNMRGNEVFGETNNPTKQSANGFSKLGPSSVPGYSGTVFEPADEYKGDFARTYFYMATAYEDRIAGWSCDMLSGNNQTCYKPWAMQMLLKWSKEDPVSEKEINRNNEVEKYQNNRNPYIDFPGLEQYIWGTFTDKSFSVSNYVSPWSDGTGISDVKTFDFSNIDSHTTVTVIYDLGGRRVTDSTNLHPGIYIRNGKRVYIK